MMDLLGRNHSFHSIIFIKVPDDDGIIKWTMMEGVMGLALHNHSPHSIIPIKVPDDDGIIKWAMIGCHDGLAWA